MKSVEICKKRKMSSGEGSYTAWIPSPFPLRSMSALDQVTLNKATHAERLIGKFDGITQTLPDIEFFLND